MTHEQTKGKTIKESFDEFDSLNPQIYTAFKREVLKAVNCGKKKLSSKAIINYLRWEMFLNTSSTDEFKINDGYTAYYSRKFIEEYPNFENLFEFRKIRAT